MHDSATTVKSTSNPLITVAMSGGVDSTVTAALLKEGGHPVEGVFLSLAQPDLTFQIDRVSAIARRLDIPFTVLDLRAEFEQEVLAYFTESYYAGRTPNPCIVCNRTIKFGRLLDKTLAGTSRRLATGHYARVQTDEGGQTRLLRGLDPKKDQSYFLCQLRQNQLSRLCFPLGSYAKEEVYGQALRLGFTEFRVRQESQDVCFLKDASVAEFLADRSPVAPAPGAIVTLAGRHIGRHSGICGFTVGQRRGLGIPNTTPYYVVALDPDANQVIVGKENDLWHRKLLVQDVNWLAGNPPPLPQAFEVKIRYRHSPAPTVVRMVSTTEYEIEFNEPQRAITPGQFAALYQGDELLAGAEIARILE